MKSVAATLMMILTACVHARESTSAEPTVCARLLDQEFRAKDGRQGWRFPTVKAQVMDHSARQAGPNPLATRGDFDGDGERDTAFLIEVASRKRIAVCLSGEPGKARFIERGVCMEGLAPLPPVLKGARRENIYAQCSEIGGTAFRFEGGIFREIEDSGSEDEGGN